MVDPLPSAGLPPCPDHANGQAVNLPSNGGSNEKAPGAGVRSAPGFHLGQTDAGEGARPKAVPSPSAVEFMLRWLCEKLIRALLWPVWLRFQAAKDVSPAAAQSAFRRFSRLVDAAPCWPCLIEYGPTGPLFILTGAAADDVRDNFFDDDYSLGLELR